MSVTNADRQGKYIRIPFLGFEIETRTDFLALAAFCLAAISGGYQVVGYLKGSDVVLFAPEAVMIVFDRYQPNLRVVRIHSTMAYVNRGQLGYNAAIAKETVSFELDGQTYEQVWQAFQGFDVKESKLVPHFTSDAHPVPVAAGSAVSHETYFAPQPKRCVTNKTTCKKWENLITAADFLAKLNGKSSLTLNFSAFPYGSEPVSQSCTISLDEDFFSNLGINGWDAPLCWPQK